MPLVFIQEREDSDPIRFELDNQGRLSRKTIDIRFPRNRGLELKGSSGYMQAVNVDEDGLYYVAPANGWPETPIKVVIHSTSRSKDDSKALGKSNEYSLNTSLKTEYISKGTYFSPNKLIKLDIGYSLPNEKLSKLREWIYVCHQGGEKKNCEVCVSVITKKYAASASHCFPNAIEGNTFNILNVDDEHHNWKVIKVDYVERHIDGKGAGVIIFSSPSGDDLFDTAPWIQQIPNIGTRYIAIGKGPFRPGDYDGITYTHGMIASNFVDDDHHIMGDSGNNAGYSGGLVLSRKGYSLLGLITSRTSEYKNLEEGLQLTLGNWSEIMGERSQPRSFILSCTYLEFLAMHIESREKDRQEMERERMLYKESLKKLEQEKGRKEHDSD